MTQVRWSEKGEGTEDAFKVIGVCQRRLDRHERPDFMVERVWAVRSPDNNGLRNATGGLQWAPFDATNMSRVSIFEVSVLCVVCAMGFRHYHKRIAVRLL
jgi:hypothetical protein